MGLKVNVNPWAKTDEKILDEDKEVLDFSKTDVNPSQVVGNPQTANLFLCLLKPEVNNYSQEVISTDTNILGQELRNLKAGKSEHYYLDSYYFYLLRQDSKVVYYDFLKNDADETYFDNLKICDLRLLAYQDATLKADKSYADLKSAKYTASLIIDRILDFSISAKPVFIFKNYDQWAQVIMQALRERTDLEDEELVAKFNLLTDYFYEFSSNDSAITKDNIHKVMKLGEYDEISDYLKEVRG